MNRCSEIMDLQEIKEILCFQYQRMMRYSGIWHLEKRMVLPGYVFVAGTDLLVKKTQWQGSGKRSCKISMTPCEAPYLKELCDDDSLIRISKGVIRNGSTVITSGPLKGREPLIRKIDRHKRTAEIEIPFPGRQKRITVGLEIYRKEI